MEKKHFSEKKNCEHLEVLKFFTRCHNLNIAATRPNESVGHKFGQKIPTVDVSLKIWAKMMGFFFQKKFVKFHLLLAAFYSDWHQNHPTHPSRTAKQHCRARPNRSEYSEKSYDVIIEKKTEKLAFF